MAKRERIVRQAAVVALHEGRVCVITSSSGKRWLLPKGHLEPGDMLRDTALQEAWEEAGLVGHVGRRPVGEYRLEKAGRVYRVAVFHMRVTKIKQDWPERNRRRRRWLTRDSALDRIEGTRLKAIINAVFRRKAA